MSMKVSYLVVNGVVLSETRSGVESDYIADPLGSTAALMSATGTITDTFTYWPYGESRSHVGSSATALQYCGTLGYYTDSESGLLYVRARELDPQTTGWITVDLIWPWERPYGYVDANPRSWNDPFGLGSCQQKPQKPSLWWPPQNWPIWPFKPHKPPKKSEGPQELCNIGCGPLCWWDKTPVCGNLCKKWCAGQYGPGKHPIKGLPNYNFCGTLPDHDCELCCAGGANLPGQQGQWSVRNCLAHCDPNYQGDY